MRALIAAIVFLSLSVAMGRHRRHSRDALTLRLMSPPHGRRYCLVGEQEERDDCFCCGPLTTTGSCDHVLELTCDPLQFVSNIAVALRLSKRATDEALEELRIVIDGSH